MIHKKLHRFLKGFYPFWSPCKNKRKEKFLMKYQAIHFNQTTGDKDEEDWNDQSTYGSLVD